MKENNVRSPFWYVLPLVFSIFGAIIAYFILRQDDKTKARNCLWLGIILFIFYAGYYVVFSLMIEIFVFS